MKKSILILSLFLLLIPLSFAQNIDMSLYVLDLGQIDLETGEFTADFYLSMYCEQACPVDTFEFMNGRAKTITNIIDEPNEKFYRIFAELNSPIDLRAYPFDERTIQIIVEDNVNTIEDVTYNSFVKESGIEESINFPGWNIDDWSAIVDNHHYSVYDETYSRFTFNINISRQSVGTFLKSFLPPLFVIIIILLSTIIGIKNVGIRLAVTSSALVASVVFHIAIINQLPPLGYLTFADKFMAFTYFVIMSNFVITILMMYLNQIKKFDFIEVVRKKNSQAMLILIPIITFLLFKFFV